MSKYPIKFDLTGQRFGKLFIVQRQDKNGHVAWKCKCDCGNFSIVETHCLRRKKGTKSCGCLSIQRTKEKNTKHGMKRKKIYNIWVGMKARCLNKNSKDYKRYGEKGITICDEWLDFENFYKDMGEPPP